MCKPTPSYTGGDQLKIPTSQARQPPEHHGAQTNITTGPTPPFLYAELQDPPQKCGFARCLSYLRTAEAPPYAKTHPTPTLLQTPPTLGETRDPNGAAIKSQAHEVLGF